MTDYDLNDVNRDALEYEARLMAEIALQSKAPIAFEIAFNHYFQAMIRWRVRAPGRRLAYRWKYLQDFRDTDVLEFCFKPALMQDDPDQPTFTRVWYRDEHFWYRLRNYPKSEYFKAIDRALDLMLFGMRFTDHNGKFLKAYALRPIIDPSIYTEE